MFEHLSTKINDDVMLVLRNKTADLFFIRTLIRFFDKKEILFKMSMEDNYNQEDVNKFQNYFLCDIYNNDCLSNEEKEMLNNIIMIMYYTIKDDLFVDFK